MNQIVIDNRKKIQDATNACFDMLVSYCEEIKKHKNNMVLIGQQPYVEDEKGRLWAEQEAFAKKKVTPICDNLRKIMSEKIWEVADAISEAPLPPQFTEKSRPVTVSPSMGCLSVYIT